MAETFSINEKVVLEVLDGPDKGVFPTRVEDASRDALVLAAPLIGPWPLQLAPGTPVRVQTDTQPSGLRYLETSVRESLPPAPGRRLPLIVLEPEGQQGQVQRRADVRLDVKLPVRFGILTNPEEAGEESEPMWPTLEATAVDLSAGGAQMVTRVRLVPGTHLDVHLRLPDNGEPLQLVGEVVRILRSESRDEHDQHWVAVRWIGAESRDRDAIVGFVFREQLRRRRRGLL